MLPCQRSGRSATSGCCRRSSSRSSRRRASSGCSTSATARSRGARGCRRRGSGTCSRRHGIAYEHRRALGTPPDLRHDFHAGRIAQARAGYRAYVEADSPEALDLLAHDVEHGPRTALLCLEEDPAGCHRRVLCELLAERLAGLEVVDL